MRVHGIQNDCKREKKVLLFVFNIRTRTINIILCRHGFDVP